MWRWDSPPREGVQKTIIRDCRSGRGHTHTHSLSDSYVFWLVNRAGNCNWRIRPCPCPISAGIDKHLIVLLGCFIPACWTAAAPLPLLLFWLIWFDLNFNGVRISEREREREREIRRCLFGCCGKCIAVRCGSGITERTAYPLAGRMNEKKIKWTAFRWYRSRSRSTITFALMTTISCSADSSSSALAGVRLARQVNMLLMLMFHAKHPFVSIVRIVIIIIFWQRWQRWQRWVKEYALIVSTALL